LIIDEVQTGIGRTGKMFAFQHYRIEPDVITLAKSLGGGLPIGAMVVGERFCGVLTPGSHASTFGGSPIVCASSLGVFEAIQKDRLLEKVNKMSAYFKKALDKLKKKKSIIGRIKILGLMIGIELNIENADTIYRRSLSKGLLINCTQKNILRIMPPLYVKKSQIDKAIKVLEECL
jgi:acetylornithine/succinyldiaminopimelate/putrescine aminotransferase